MTNILYKLYNPESQSSTTTVTTGTVAPADQQISTEKQQNLSLGVW